MSQNVHQLVLVLFNFLAHQYYIIYTSDLTKFIIKTSKLHFQLNPSSKLHLQLSPPYKFQRQVNSLIDFIRAECYVVDLLGAEVKEAGGSMGYKKKCFIVFLDRVGPTLYSIGHGGSKRFT